MADDPYSRLYWRLSDEFPEIWDDAEMLGTYVQLLVAADAMWPSRPHLPAGADTDRLAACGLVLIDGRRYSIKGLDKERKRRQKQGRKGAAGRWSDADRNAQRNADSNALSNAVSSAKGMPSRAEPRRDETSQDEFIENEDGSKTRKKRGLTPLSEILQ